MSLLSDGELLFRLLGFPQTWPTNTRDGERAGLTFADSLQFHWVKHNMKLQSSTNTSSITAAKTSSTPLSSFPLAINLKPYVLLLVLAACTGM